MSKGSWTFTTNRHPGLTLTSGDGAPVEFRNGVATVTDKDKAEHVRDWAADNPGYGVTEFKGKDGLRTDGHEDVVARELSEPIPEQVVGSRPLAFTPDDVPRSEFSESYPPGEDPTVSEDASVPVGERPQRTVAIPSEADDKAEARKKSRSTSKRQKAGASK